MSERLVQEFIDQSPGRNDHEHPKLDDGSGTKQANAKRKPNAAKVGWFVLGKLEFKVPGEAVSHGRVYRPD